MCITLHLSTLNFICHFSAQAPGLSSSFYSRTLSSVVLIVLYNFVSSANIDILLCSLSIRSLINILIRMGPSTEPCGTPLTMVAHSEYEPFITTLCFLSLSQFFTQIDMFSPSVSCLI
ncbi:hypothetical protein GDO78_015223 [Eleutherodactylus coqui]|uniref:Uncharacterized protein n=1 Tax=Eleutherodactylus coqui TaxID=57060 RepID=A0A8J6JWW8_ELECQ|nr:hypothetical protein GDO78_015223 [Eleutherodactylus coqui]